MRERERVQLINYFMYWRINAVKISQRWGDAPNKLKQLIDFFEFEYEHMFCHLQ